MHRHGRMLDAHHKIPVSPGQASHRAQGVMVKVGCSRRSWVPANSTHPGYKVSSVHPHEYPAHDPSCRALVDDMSSPKRTQTKPFKPITEPTGRGYVCILKPDLDVCIVELPEKDYSQDITRYKRLLVAMLRIRYPSRVSITCNHGDTSHPTALESKMMPVRLESKPNEASMHTCALNSIMGIIVS